jgi:transposase
MSATQISRDLGITPSNLSRWKKNKERESMSKNGHSNNSLEEAMKTIKNLKKELAIAEEERDILKKAVSFFAKK